MNYTVIELYDDYSSTRSSLYMTTHRYVRVKLRGDMLPCIYDIAKKTGKNTTNGTFTVCLLTFTIAFKVDFYQSHYRKHKMLIEHEIS